MVDRVLKISVTADTGGLLKLSADVESVNKSLGKSETEIQKLQNGIAAFKQQSVEAYKALREQVIAYNAGVSSTGKTSIASFADTSKAVQNTINFLATLNKNISETEEKLVKLSGASTLRTLGATNVQKDPRTTTAAIPAIEQRNPLTGQINPNFNQKKILEAETAALSGELERRKTLYNSYLRETYEAQKAAAAKLLAEQKKRDASADTFRAGAEQAKAALEKQLADAQAIRAAAGDRIKLQELQTANDIIQIKQNLANRLLQIEQQLRNGQTNAGLATIARNRATADADKQITAAQIGLETAKRTQSEQLASYNSFLSQKENATKAAIDREKAIHIHGIKSIEVARHDAAQRELQLREKLNNFIASRQEKVASGAISPTTAATQTAKVYEAYSRAVIGANKALLEQEKSAELASNAQRNLFIRVGEIIGIYRVYNFVLNTVVNSIKAIPQIGIQLEATKAVLAATTENATIAGNVFAQLTKEADRAGLQITTVRESFRTFNASATLAGESLESVWRMFTNINTVSTALHNTTDQTNHIFAALAQIFNKSKVQAEELVKQLGNIIPGAFASFAAANKDIYANTAELISAMKQGTVFAHETVENFTNFLADRFGKAFTLASDGLNANINRMKNSFTELGEAIYGMSSGPLVSATKAITSFVQYLTKSTQETTALSNAAKIAANVGIGALFVAVGNLTAKLISATLAGKGLISALTFFSVPGAIVAGILAIGKSIRDMNSEFRGGSEDLEKYLNVLKSQQASDSASPLQQLETAIENDPAVANIKNLLNVANQELDEWKKVRVRADALSKYGVPGSATAGKFLLDLPYVDDVDTNIKLVVDRIKRGQEELTKASEEARKGFLETQKNLAVEAKAAILGLREDSEIAAATALGDAARAATLQAEKTYRPKIKELQNDIKQFDKEIEKTLAATNLSEVEKAKKVFDIHTEIEANNQAIKGFELAIASAGDKISKKASVKEFKLQIKDFERELALAAEQTALDLQNLTTNYDQNLIAISDYFAKKEEMILKDLETQKRAYEEGLLFARNSGDRGKQQEFEDKLALVDIKGPQQLNTNANEQLAATKEYENQLKSIKAELLEIQGLTKDAALVRYDLDKAQLIIRLTTEYNAAVQQGKQEQAAAAQAALNTLNIQRDLAGVQGELAAIRELEAIQEQKYNELVARTNALQQTGVISQLEAFAILKDAGEDYVKVLEDIARKKGIIFEELPPVVQQGPEGQNLQQDMQSYKQKILEVQQASNGLTNAISQNVSSAFSGFFSSIILGTENVKEAFKKMLASMLEQIVNFLIQESIKKFISLILGSIGGGYGAIGGIIAGAASGAASGAVGGGSSFAAAGGNTSFSSSIPVSKNLVSGFPDSKTSNVVPFTRPAGNKASTATAPGSQVVNNVFNISTSVTSDTKDPDLLADKVVERQVRALAQQEIAKASRPGNSLNKTTVYK